MSRKIWIVDDNADSRMLARAILTPEFELMEMETGAEAVEQMATDRPDLLLLDLSMPGMSGFEVLAAMRDRPELMNVPVVAFTARASESERNGILAFGFDDCVVKPLIDEEQLLGPVTRLLRPAPRMVSCRG